MKKAKPVLLLDVDGVLNVIGKDTVDKKVVLGNGMSFYPVPLTRPFMAWAWKHFEVFWLTAWFDMANEIAKWAKLSDLVSLPDRTDAGDYKLNAVKKHFGSYEGEVIWIEDGIGKEAEAWVTERKNFLYVKTDTSYGLLDEHLKTISDWAGVKLPKEMES